MDCRIPLTPDKIITLGGIDYTITSLVGFGASAFVYQARYADNLHKDKTHTVLLKELFPYHPKGLITRNNDGSISVDDEAKEYFELYRGSFLRGNVTHLDFQNQHADKASVNINSYETNNTLYTILAQDGGETLQSAMDNENIKNSLYDITVCMINILDTLSCFHKNNLLHLDVSPDNILLLPLDKGKSEKYRRVILVDYNSVWNKDELLRNENIFLSKKEHYSAPELRLSDLNSICPATDLFSVGAMFLEYLQGQPLDFTKLYSSKKVPQGKIKLFDNAPKTVVQKASMILHKGLKLPPNQRYQTAGEFKADFIELLNRIEGKGVTHSGLWEINARQKIKTPEALLENHIEVNGERLSADKITDYENVILTGDGGIGKTTVLLRLKSNNAKNYNPKEPVAIYIPLYKYNGANDFIKRFIIEKIKFDENTETVRDAIFSLEKLLDAKEHVITLLLDGLNEASANIKELLKEIDAFSKTPSVHIILTSRTESIKSVGLTGFQSIKLLPLEIGEIRKYLLEVAVPLPTDENTLKLLSNPMMLKMYASTSKTWAQSDQSKLLYTSKDIVSEYLDSLILSQKQVAVGDEVRQWRMEFIINHLLPQIAGAMKNKPFLTQAELFRVVEKNYKMLKSNPYSLAFKKYTGKSRIILTDIKDAGEWFDLAAINVAVKELALIECEKDKYRFSHQNFQDCLKEKYAENKKHYNAALIKKNALPTFVTLIICAMVIWSATIIFPSEFPRTKQEINLNNTAMNGVIVVIAGIDEQIRNEKRALQDLLTVPPGVAQSNIRQATEKNDALEFDSIDSMLFVNTPLSVDQLEDIYKQTKTHGIWQKDMLARFSTMIDSESVYTEKHKREAVENYLNYLENYEKIIFAKIYRLMLPLNETGKKEVLKALSYSSEIGRVYITFDPPQNAADLDNTIFKLQENLDAMERKLDLIRE